MLFCFIAGIVFGMPLGAGVCWLVLLISDLCSRDPEEVAARSLEAIQARLEQERQSQKDTHHS